MARKRWELIPIGNKGPVKRLTDRQIIDLLAANNEYYEKKFRDIGKVVSEVLRINTLEDAWAFQLRVSEFLLDKEMSRLMFGEDEPDLQKLSKGQF